MSVDKLVDSTQLNSDLTSVANAIRTKGGTSVTLTFPADFVTAIGNIPTGITPTGTKQISISSAGTTTEDVTNYASAEITVGAGTEGTPTATKGVVSGHAVSVTPSVTNSAGYISGGTKTGTAVSVSASELVSGTYSVTGSGTANVTNYASISVPSGSATTPATTVTATPSISVNSSGLITATVSATKSVTPSVSAGYVSSGTAGTVTVSGSATQQLTVYNGAHHVPTPAGYTVTISLTNPVNSQYFQSGSVCEALSDDPWDTGNELGTFSSPTDSISVVVPTTVYGIEVVLTSNYIGAYPWNATCTGGVSVSQNYEPGMVVFEVTGNGTIVMDGVNYNDD